MAARTPRLTAALVALAVLVAACGAPPSPEQREPEPGAVASWSAVAGSPLGPRFGATALWTGREVIVIGGHAADPCPPNADCARPPGQTLADGAAYDPASDTWRVIAPAPQPIDRALGAVVGDTVYLLPENFDLDVGPRPTFLAYDLTTDAWEQLPLPDGADGLSGLIALNDSVTAVQDSHENGVILDQRLDPATNTWMALPDDPLGPSYNRSMAAHDGAGILFASDLVPQPNSVEPSLVRAAALDPVTGAWTILPDSPVLGGWPAWITAAGLVVNATLGSSDGGQVNNWGREVPHGGILDPAAPAWRPLPNPPALDGPYPGISAGGGEWVISANGWVLHVPSGTWMPLPRPPGPDVEAPATAWLGDRLFVWGGATWPEGGGAARILANGWTWSPD